MTMKKHVPKTGLAARMREAMRAFKRPFTTRALYDALGAESAAEKQRIYNALYNFQARGEITRTASGRIRYNHGWRPVLRGNLNKKVFKAMWVSPQGWSVSDIARLIATEDASYVYRIVRKLREKGLIEQCGTRSMSPYPGQEYLYRITDRDKFRKEVMKNGAL